MKNLFKIGLFIFGVFLLVSSCGKKEYEPIQSVDGKLISAFIARNNLKVNRSDSGYYYQVLAVGQGPLLKYSDSIAYQMSVKSLSGVTFFETNKYHPVENLLGYFPGFLPVQQTLKGIPNGSSVRVIIPSYDAFGTSGNPAFGVGPNENLDVSVKTHFITDRARYEDSLINLYIKDKGLVDVAKTKEGVYYQVVNKGDTDHVIHENSVIRATYFFRVLGRETIVEASTLIANLNALIKGVVLALEGQGKGVKIRCFIPSRYAYGDGKSVKTGLRSSAFGNTILDYEIEVLEVRSTTL